LDATIASDEVQQGRPHPDMIRRAMELTGVSDPGRVAKVGDTPADLHEGEAAQCALIVGVTSGSHTRDELAAHPHTHLIDRLSTLLTLVQDVDAAYERAPGAVDVPLLFTPGPLTTSYTVKAAMMADLGSRDSEFIQMVARVRDDLLAIAGAGGGGEYTAIPMQGSGTFAVEAMLGTLVPQEAGLLILENGAYGRRMAEVARVLGIRCVTVSTPANRPLVPDLVREAVASHDSMTHVAMVHCETTTGVLNPLAQVAAVVAETGCRLLVDAMSSFGAIPIDVRDGPIDALAASANKCLESVPGIAFVIARLDALQTASHPRSVSLDLAAQWRGLEADGQF